MEKKFLFERFMMGLIICLYVALLFVCASNVNARTHTLKSVTGCETLYEAICDRHGRLLSIQEFRQLVYAFSKDLSDNGYGDVYVNYAGNGANNYKLFTTEYNVDSEGNIVHADSTIDIMDYAGNMTDVEAVFEKAVDTFRNGFKRTNMSDSLFDDLFGGNSNFKEFQKASERYNREVLKIKSGLVGGDIRIIASKRMFNYAYKMWLKYDAKRSWEQGVSGSVFIDGKGWHHKKGKKYQRKVFETYGRWIPFLGYDESFYQWYYENLSVFTEYDKTRVEI